MKMEMTIFKAAQAPTTTTPDDDFNQLAGGFNALPRMTLMTSNSEEVKSGDFPTNTYALKVGEKLENLGKNVDVVVVAHRLTALWATDDFFCSSHVLKDPLFQEIINVADNQGFGSGAVYGPEFLLWIPSMNSFGTFMCGSKTARNMAQNIRALTGEVATFGSKKFDNKKFQWYGPDVAPANSVITAFPDEELLNATVHSFTSEVGKPKELAEEAAPTSDRD